MLSTIRAASPETPDSLQAHFAHFREHTIGIRHSICTPYGRQPLLYADWTASGRLYEPIERKIQDTFGPYVSNPHTESNLTGMTMTKAYAKARAIIKRHVHAGPRDMLLFCGNGTTGAINKLQRLMGLKAPAWAHDGLPRFPDERPVIFTTHMEHHSNLLPWQEGSGDIVTIPPGDDGRVDPRQLEALLPHYRHRRWKIGSFTACSNVTGLHTPYHKLAEIMHRHGGVCFVDFAASAPYESIDMHPDEPYEKLDAIFFSPHKFLGGPGTTGILVMNASLCSSTLPDEPGGGTVMWVNPWGGRRYIKDMEMREDGGTPGFLQAFRTALCIHLKESMDGPGGFIMAKEQELCRQLMTGLRAVPGLTLLDGAHSNRLGIVSFTLQNIHYNLAVQLLNDRFGIQARGGCSCAGPYGHLLLGIHPELSSQIFKTIESGDHSLKPGWVRLSLHPIMTSNEVDRLIDAVGSIVRHRQEWSQDYRYDPASNGWAHIHADSHQDLDIAELFEL